MKWNMLGMVLSVLLQGFQAIPADQQSEKGYHSLFMGHSFFVPVSKRFRDLARTAGITGHSQHEVFKGGGGGAPGSLWNDERKRRQILGILKTGKIDLIGMTYYDRSNSSLEHYVRWVDVALEHNSETQVFIGMPWGKNGGSRTLEEYSRTGLSHYREFYAKIILPLRGKYPKTKILSVYYGLASLELKKRFEAGSLPGVTQIVGKFGSVYTDKLGHAGAMLKDVGALVWLSVIYGVDLEKVDLKLKYKADVKAIAVRILEKELSLSSAKEK